MKSSCLIVLPAIFWLALAIATLPARAESDPRDGAFGRASDARRGALVMAANPVYSGLPLTVECRVRLLGKDQYNILIANETKASFTHWEVFTTPGDGTLHAYVPGRAPDHVHTTVPLVDGQWHWVAMVMEEGRIAFVSERRGGYIRCFAAYLKGSYTLFSMCDVGRDLISPNCDGGI